MILQIEIKRRQTQWQIRKTRHKRKRSRKNPAAAIRTMSRRAATAPAAAMLALENPARKTWAAKSRAMRKGWAARSPATLGRNNKFIVQISHLEVNDDEECNCSHATDRCFV